MNDGNSYEEIIQNVDQMTSESYSDSAKCSVSEKKIIYKITENSEKASAVWTYSATLTLLKLYDNKLGMLETPKKKTRIWNAISKSLKDYNIEMSADQVRWKINALTKKYKQCLDTGHPIKFVYFNEMDKINSKYNVYCDTFVLGDLIHKDLDCKQSNMNDKIPIQLTRESKATIEVRKIRLANRIESDRSQSKLNLEKQWLEYVRKQEQNKLMQDEIFHRNLKIKEEELELFRQEIEIMESMELKKLQLKEREQNELLSVEKEKCEMLKQFLDNKPVE